MSEAQPEAESSQPRKRRSSLPRALLVLVASAGLTSACIWGYVRLGGGATGSGGFLLLLAPGAALATALLVPKSRARARARWASLLLGVALPYLLVSCELREYVGRQTFDPVVWKAAAGGRSQARIRQVDHLLASATLDGRTRAAVLDLLGPDDGAKGTGWGNGYFAGWDSVYWLGNERGIFSIDSEWLVLRFSANDTVSEYRIVRD